MKNILLITAFLTCTYCLSGQKSDTSAKIDSIIGLKVTRNTPGCIVGVLKDGELLYKKCFGMANMDFGIPVTDSTVFNLASVSKQFTAFLVLMLEQEGKLSLDDELQKYFPELKSYSHVTIRELIHHTSGIPSSDNVRLFAGLSLEMPWNSEDEFNLIQSYQKLNFKPNEEHNYSNTGYFLLSLIIEKASGMNFSQYMAEKIFKPLGMKNACVYDSPGKIIPNRASGYRRIKDTYSKANTEGDSFSGCTNLYVSANDMIGWTANLTRKSVGGEQLFEKILIPEDTLNNGDTIQYTYGFNVSNYRGLKMVEHSGGTNGFNTQIMHFPGASFTVFILCNDESSEPWNLAKKITELYLNDLLIPEAKVEHKEINISKNLYKLYEGSYQLPDGMILQFDVIDDTLKLVIPGAPKFVMYAEKENEFFLKDFDAQCTFVKDKGGKVGEIVWHQNNQNPKGIRYTVPKPFSEVELNDFAGKYEIPQLNVTYTVSINENELTLNLPKIFKSININPEMKLRHIGGDKFFGVISIIEFKRNKSGRVTGLVINDVGRMKNIELTKRCYSKL